MPGQDFSVQIDPEQLDLAAIRAPRNDATPSHPAPAAVEATHHGARDGRQAARRRSEKDRAGRAAGAGSGRSYAFRRS
jgi:hypothetical protein